MSGVDMEVSAKKRAPLPISELDFALTAQIAVAWAGEGGEEPRLGWWRTDLATEFGGEDLFRRIVPHTWEWAVLQAVREAARRKDAELRAKVHDPDELLSLYRLGFEFDQRLDERFQDLKASGKKPYQALAGLSDIVTTSWDKQAFADWVEGHGKASVKSAPVGRLLTGDRPASLQTTMSQLVAALAPLSEAYPLPHFRGKR